MSTKRGQKPGTDTTGSTGRTTNNSTTSATATSTTPSTSSSPANAWARPLRTQGTSPAPPGMGLPSNDKGAKSLPVAKGSTNGSPIPAILRERFLHMNLALVGQKVVVTETNGTVFEGIFHTFTPFTTLPPESKNKYVIKACKTIKQPEGGGDSLLKDGATAILPAEKVAYILAKNMNLGQSTNGSTYTPPPPASKKGDALRTDTEISAGRTGRSRDLVAAGSAWTTGNSSRADAFASALEDKGGSQQRQGFASQAGNTGSGLKGTIGEWDQFKANQELFNVSATFDENLYTTELDKSRMDARKIAEAERIAREIENTSSSNIHVSEERGHVVEGDYDEEDRYSGVLTKDGTVRHAQAKKPTKSAESGDKHNDNEKSKSNSPKTVPVQTTPKKMNYAAAAAKADSKKAAPPGFAAKSVRPPTESKPKEETTPAVETSESDKVPEKTVQPAVTTPPTQPQAKTTTTTADKKQEKEEPQPEKKEPEVKEVEKVPPAEPIPPVTKEKIETTPVEENVAKTEEPKKGTAGQGEQSEIAAPAPATEKSETKVDKAKEVPAATKGSKLNANAKEFTFNPSASAWQPTSSFAPGRTGVPATVDGQAQAVTDSNANMPMQPGGHGMQAPHYMHAGPMGQPGMMPMMNPPYPGMRYQSPYPGMDQHMSQMQSHQPQHVQSAAAPAANTTAPTQSTNNEDDSGHQEGDGSQQTAPHQQQQMPMPYNVGPPGAYFAGGMAMHPRGPGYPPQFVGGPQQMPVGPGGGPYRHMYPMQPGGMPPNMHMRGPGGAPYYPGPNGPIPYAASGYVPHGMMDDGDSGFRGRGRGQGGARRGRGRGRGGRGPGRGNYPSSYTPHGGRQGPQHQVSASDAPPAAVDGSTTMDAGTRTADATGTRTSAES